MLLDVFGGVGVPLFSLGGGGQVGAQGLDGGAYGVKGRGQGGVGGEGGLGREGFGAERGFGLGSDAVTLFGGVAEGDFGGEGRGFVGGIFGGRGVEYALVGYFNTFCIW